MRAINDYDDEEEEDEAENDAVNLIHLIKQGRNVCYPRIKPPNEGALIWTSFSHDILIFTKITNYKNRSLDEVEDWRNHKSNGFELIFGRQYSLFPAEYFCTLVNLVSDDKLK